MKIGGLLVQKYWSKLPNYTLAKKNDDIFYIINQIKVSRGPM